MKRITVRPPENVISFVERALRSDVRSIVPVGGGCISNASRVATDSGDFFLKWAAAPAGETFVAEGNGLAALAESESSLVVPRPIVMRNPEPGGVGVLLMEWIEEGPKTTAFWQRLGTGLADLHLAVSRTEYGFEDDNFIGRLPQQNEPHSSWTEFFAACRILPQVKMARDSGRWTRSWDAGLDGLLKSLPSILPADPHPSLVHGDLWAGNVLATDDGRAAIVDPAVYRGDREVDLAMSELFGGFSPTFYESYNDAWPLEPEYGRRRDVYNLYHLINHLNHFGSSYAGQVAAILRRFA